MCLRITTTGGSSGGSRQVVREQQGMAGVATVLKNKAEERGDINSSNCHSAL